MQALPALCGFCMTLGLNGNGSLKEAHLPCLEFRPSNVLWTFGDLTRWEGAKLRDLNKHGLIPGPSRQLSCPI